MLNKMFAVGAFAVFILPHPVLAADEVSASFQWNGAQLSRLKFSRDQKSIPFSQSKISLTFKDPRKKGEIEKILVDRSYRPGDATYADFWVETTIKSPISKMTVSETSLCTWNMDKSIATCSIEDDGGRFLIVAEDRSDTLKSSKFAFVVMRLAGYSGFRLAEDKPVGSEPKEPHSIDVKLVTDNPVLSSINF
jgi:hypothetical protein